MKQLAVKNFTFFIFLVFLCLYLPVEIWMIGKGAEPGDADTLKGVMVISIVTIFISAFFLRNRQSKQGSDLSSVPQELNPEEKSAVNRLVFQVVVFQLFAIAIAVILFLYTAIPAAYLILAGVGVTTLFLNNAVRKLNAVS